MRFCPCWGHSSKISKKEERKEQKLLCFICCQIFSTSQLWNTLKPLQLDEGYRWAFPELGQGASGCLQQTPWHKRNKGHTYNFCLESISGSKHHVCGCSLSPSQQNYCILHQSKYTASEKDTCCTRSGLDWKLEKTSSLKGLFSPGTGCPGQGWSHHPWRSIKSHVDVADGDVVGLAMLS